MPSLRASALRLVLLAILAPCAALAGSAELEALEQRLRLQGNQLDLAEALEVGHRALALARQEDESGVEASLHHRIALAYQRAGQLESAEAALLASIGRVHVHMKRPNRDPVDYFPGPEFLGTLHGQLADVRYALGRYESAIEALRSGPYLDPERFTWAAGGRPQQVWVAWHRQKVGINAFRLGRMRLAAKELEHALSLFEDAREDSGRQRLPLREVHDLELEARLWLQRVRVAQGEPLAALALAERSRARTLLERMRGDVAPSAAAADVEILRHAAARSGSHLLVFSLLYSYAPWSELRLDGYDRTPIDEVLIWLIEPEGNVHFRRSPLGGTPLLPLIEEARLGIGVGGRGLRISPTDHPPTQVPLERLHALLIAPVAELLPAEPDALVTVVPQDLLFLVPFPALRAAGGKALIDRHTLSIVPSGATLEAALELQSRIPDRARHVVVVGDPTMPTLPPLEDGTPVQLPPLPGARAEAKAVAALYGADPLLGERATTAALLSRTSRARLIHLATHGLLDGEEGLHLGSLAFAPVAGASGFLRGREIRALDLSAELVVLSACDTGGGRITGDGLVGLSHGFLAAGVPSVLASLWAVDDASTRDLMTGFHREIRAGRGKAAALRAAMLAVREQYPNPRHWGAFALFGAPTTSPGLASVKEGAPADRTPRDAYRAPRPLVPVTDDAHHGYAAEADDGSQVTFSTRMSPDDVKRFYERQLTALGMKRFHPPQSVAVEELTLLTFHDDENVLRIHLSQHGNAGSFVTASYAEGYDRRWVLEQAGVVEP